MDTEVLNEYIYAKLVAEEARIARRHRMSQMEADGVPDEEIANTPVTQGDLRRAVDALEWFRAEALALQREVQRDPP